MRRDINTARAVACFESRDPSRVLDNWFICEYEPGEKSVRNYFTEYANGATEVCGLKFEKFCGALIGFVLRMHRMGVFFRDLAGGNLIVQIDECGQPDFTLIDTGRIQAFPFSLNRRRRVADLRPEPRRLR